MNVFFLFWKQRKKARRKILTKNRFQHRIITFIELDIFLDGILIVVLNYKKQIHRKLHTEQQFYENENQENWKSPDFLNLKEKKTKRLEPYVENELGQKKNDINNVIWLY